MSIWHKVEFDVDDYDYRQILAAIEINNVINEDKPANYLPDVEAFALWFVTQAAYGITQRSLYDGVDNTNPLVIDALKKYGFYEEALADLEEYNEHQ